MPYRPTPEPDENAWQWGAGTEVAKQVADIVLVNNDLSALIPVIAEGRRAHDNLRRFLHFGQLVDSRAVRAIAVLGLFVAASSLLAAAYAARSGGPCQSTIFLSFTFAQLCIAMALRPRGGKTNWFLTGSVVLNTALAWLAVSWLPLQELLNAAPMTVRDVVPCLLAAAVAGGATRWQTRPRHLP